MTRWDDLAEDSVARAAQYAADMAERQLEGEESHGEADAVMRLRPAPASVLDAGCGTGRVAIRLRSKGYQVVGVDADRAMLDVAASLDPDGEWVHADLAGLSLERSFDVVIAAGNVIPLLAAGTEAAAVNCLAAHLNPGGVLIAGFGLDPEHLPLEEAPVTIDEYDEWCASAGLTAVVRCATWEGEPWTFETGYAVSVHRRD